MGLNILKTKMSSLVRVFYFQTRFYQFQRFWSWNAFSDTLFRCDIFADFTAFDPGTRSPKLNDFDPGIWLWHFYQFQRFWSWNMSPDTLFWLWHFYQFPWFWSWGAFSQTLFGCDVFTNFKDFDPGICSLRLFLAVTFLPISVILILERVLRYFFLAVTFLPISAILILE